MTYDVVVLGGGPGGYAAAFRASLLGLKVAIVERDKLGGTCLHRGCIPSKGLLHAAEMMDAFETASTWGITASAPSFDWAKVQAAKWEPVNKLFAGLQSVAKHRKVDVIAGDGQLGDPQTIVVGDQKIQGKNIILAVGSFARSLPFAEPDGERILTSDHALVSDTFPSSVCVIGASAVGCEFASVYRSFGAEVTMLEALPRMVPLEDTDVSKEFQAAYRKRGIKVETGVQVSAIERTSKGVKITYGDKTFEVDQVMIAVGRGPNTNGLDLDKWGIKSERGYILADPTGAVAPNVYAIGDCVAGVPGLAHVASAQGMAVAERIAGGTPHDVDIENGIYPRCTYSEPEIASVGLTEEQARAKYGEVVVQKSNFTGNAKAQILGEVRGFMKLVARKDGPLVGVHMIGPRVSELLAEAQVSVGWEALPEDVAAFIHPHPTLSEVFGEAALAAIGRPFHG